MTSLSATVTICLTGTGPSENGASLRYCEPWLDGFSNFLLKERDSIPEAASLDS
jgi:hypothetical protein